MIKKLMLIDGMAMVYRAYYALNRSPRVNSKGINTSAALGFTTTLYDLLRMQRPTHVAVAFDLQHPTFRHQEYESYKANRDAMPEDIQTAMPYIHAIIEAFRIPILTHEGFEADDVIGTAASMAEHIGFDEILMVTPDKDFAQLVTEHIHLYRFGRKGKPDSVYGVQEVCEAFGVSACSQVADLLGLWGDSIDNIPGIPGVGEKKAKQLIATFGSVEALVQRYEEIPNEKLRNAVEQYREQALLSKHLATIVKDAPIAFSEEMVRRLPPDYTALQRLFVELEFKNFSKKFFADLAVSDPALANEILSQASPTHGHHKKPFATQAPQNNTSDALLFTEPSAVGDVKEKPVATATQGSLFDGNQELQEQLSLFEEPRSGRPEELEVGDLQQAYPQLKGKDVAIFFQDTTLAVATSADQAYTLPVERVQPEALQMLLESAPTVVCYNLKNLKYILQEWGVTLHSQVFDVQLVHYLIDAEVRHTLDFICSSTLGTVPDDAASSAASLWQLYPLLASRLRDGNQERLYYEIELPLVDALISMEQEGVRIDVEALQHYSQQLTAERDALEQEIIAMAGGTPFNISSTKQLGEVLYVKMKIVDNPPRTATKQYSTAEDVLRKLQDKHPIVGKILEYRSLTKLIGTYLDSFPNLINPATGRLHTIYNQTVTTTGRLSSSNPNLQNIPIRTERGREIRRAFVPRSENYILMAADYSQIELRIIASLAHDEHMTDAFAHHYDIHAATAAKIYHVPMEEVSADQRRNAKSVNFGIVYGISAFGLGEQLGISRKAAGDLIDDYFSQFPRIKEYIDSNIAFAHEHGYAQTLLGRRRYLYDINSRNASARAFAERNAVNMPVQGTSADMIKIAMNRIFARFNQDNLRSKMILQVHDELVFDVYKPEEEQVRHIVEEEMLQALPLDIPVEVSVGVGCNWLEAH